MLQVVDHSEHTGPANQSEYIVLFGRRAFIETGTKQRLHPNLHTFLVGEKF